CVRHPPAPTFFPYTTLFRSNRSGPGSHELRDGDRSGLCDEVYRRYVQYQVRRRDPWRKVRTPGDIPGNSNDYDEMHHLVGKKPRCTITFTLRIHTRRVDSQVAQRHDEHERPH